MPKHTDRVRIEEVDWIAVFPWLRLLGAFRMAIHPHKLFTALLLVILLFVLGRGLDLLLGSRVETGELDQYRQVHFGLQSPDQFNRWCEERDKSRPDAVRALLAATPDFRGDIEKIVTAPNALTEAREQLHAHYVRLYSERDAAPRESTSAAARQREAELEAIRDSRRRALAVVQSLERRGAFDASLKASIDAVDRLVRAAATLNLGWSQTVAARSSRPEADPLPEADGPLATKGDALGYHDQTTVVAALRDLFVILPAWLWEHHRLFFVLYTLAALIACALLGGVVARMAAVQATRDDRIGFREAMRYVARRWWSFLLTPLVPAGILAVAVLLMALLGLFFIPRGAGVDIIGALLFFAAILCGFIVAGTLLLTTAGIHLAYPATAIDGSDVFDAIARAFNYVLNRPWRWLFHSLVSLVHGAVTYLLLSLVLYITVWAVQAGMSAWVFTTTEMGVNRFDTILPPPAIGQLAYDIDYASLDWSGRIAAFIVRCWMFLVIGLLSAFAISYYLCANTWIYLLLRRSADGVELEDVVVDPPGDAPAKPIAEDTSPAPDAESEEE